MAAEYILKEGNEQVMLCERGIRTFETGLPLHARPDGHAGAQGAHAPAGGRRPSHAAGRRDLVLPLSLAAAAAGADGIIVEIHLSPRPRSATARSSSWRRVRRVPAPGRGRARAVAGKAVSAVDGRPVSARSGPRRRPDRRLDRARRARAAWRRGGRLRRRPADARGGRRARRDRRAPRAVEEARRRAPTPSSRAPVGALPSSSRGARGGAGATPS